MDLEPHLRRLGNQAISQAARFTAALGFVGSVGIALYLLVGAGDEVWLAFFASLWGGVSSLVVWALAREERLHGATATVTLVLYSQMPTFLFLATHQIMPHGAVAFATGPMSYVYPVLITFSACLLRPRLPLLVSVVCAVAYYVSYELGRPLLLTLEVDNPILQADLRDRFSWANKSMMLLFTGLVTSAVTLVAQRLAIEAVREASERDRVRRMFGQYVSDEVAAHVLSREDGRSGSRAEVVVLFSDIRGFTTYSESADADALVTRLNAYFDAMVEAISTHGGVVDKFIGDAVMAVFDGVLPLDDPEDAALNAAIAMQGALADLNRGWQAEGLEPWRAGIGIHRGPVVLGSLGSESRRDFTVIGDAVNTASRLEGLTKDVGVPILLSQAVVDRLTDPTQADSVGEIPIRGRAQTLSAYAIRTG